MTAADGFLGLDGPFRFRMATALSANGLMEVRQVNARAPSRCSIPAPTKFADLKRAIATLPDDNPAPLP